MATPATPRGRVGFVSRLSITAVQQKGIDGVAAAELCRGVKRCLPHVWLPVNLLALASIAVFRLWHQRLSLRLDELRSELELSRPRIWLPAGGSV